MSPLRYARGLAVFTGLCCVSLVPPTAHAAFPGQNGKIAFMSSREGQFEFNVYSVSPNGGAETRLTNYPAGTFRDPAWSADGRKLAHACLPTPTSEPSICITDADGSGLRDLAAWYPDPAEPAWSPDGSRITFAAEEEFCESPGDPEDCWYQWDVLVMTSDGGPFDNLTAETFFGYFETSPAWSPDGTTIAFDTWSHYDYIETIRPDGSQRSSIGLAGQRPDWSPDGTKLVYERYVDGNNEIFVGNSDGTGEMRITTNSVNDWAPVWSPDGTKIAFGSTDGGDEEIFVMNRDGSGRHAVTDNTFTDGRPDWQPIPYTGYPRPKGATPTYVPLVPAYRACSVYDRTHGPPLAHGSCSGPDQVSPHLTVGTPDANGRPAKSTGNVRYGTAGGDVNFYLRFDDVRVASDLSDYEGELELRSEIRITDRRSGPGADEPATMETLDFPITVPCTATADTTIGAHCEITTTVEAITPGAVTQGARSVWEFGRARVYDGGPDGVVATQDNSLFAVQGLFVP